MNEKLNGYHEPLLRIYDSLKNFVGENRVYRYGDVLYVSTRNNDEYDVFITGDGKSTFMQLYDAKEEENYAPVTTPAELSLKAGEDIMVKSNEVANAFNASMPYFKDILVKGAEVSQTVTMKATEKITLDGVTIAGEKGQSNGKITYAAKELHLKNITAKENATLYNAFEGYQTTTDPNYKGLKTLIAEDFDINCPSITHNIINVYTPADGAEMLVRNSKFNITVDNTNPLRLANYMNAENVTVVFENCDWTYENGVTKNDWRWAGLVIYQPSVSDVALGGDLSKLKTWTFVFRNCRYNGEKVTGNNFGQHNQVFYLYDINHTGQVTDPAEAGIRIVFE